MQIARSRKITYGTLHITASPLQDISIRWVVITQLDDLVPRHALKTPFALVVLTLNVVRLVLARRWAVQRISPSILSSQGKVHDRSGDPAHGAKRQGCPVSGSESGRQRPCFLHVRYTHFGASAVR